MPYLPPNILQDTVFPRAYTKDLLMQIKMIRERYIRFYPQIAYRMLLKQTTPVERDVVVATSPDNANLITGADGVTQFDTLYREDVPETTHAVGWQQPHDSDAHNASEGPLFANAVTVNARFYREAKKTEIQNWGFDKMRDVVLTIPLILLDDVGLTCKEGDTFVYAGETYLVSEANTSGYWKNTAVSLYIALNCQYQRLGS